MLFLRQKRRNPLSKKIMMIRRYEIYNAEQFSMSGCNTRKKHPVVIVSHDVLNKYLRTVVVCPLTSAIPSHKWKSRLLIKCNNQHAEIAVDKIRTISKKLLKNKIDTLPKSKAEQLGQLITDMFG